MKKSRFILLVLIVLTNLTYFSASGQTEPIIEYSELIQPGDELLWTVSAYSSTIEQPGYSPEVGSIWNLTILDHLDEIFAYEEEIDLTNYFSLELDGNLFDETAMGNGMTSDDLLSMTVFFHLAPVVWILDGETFDCTVLYQILEANITYEGDIAYVSVNQSDSGEIATMDVEYNTTTGIVQSYALYANNSLGETTYEYELTSWTHDENYVPPEDPDEPIPEEQEEMWLTFSPELKVGDKITWLVESELMSSFSEDFSPEAGDEWVLEIVGDLSEINLSSSFSLTEPEFPLFENYFLFDFAGLTFDEAFGLDDSMLGSYDWLVLMLMFVQPTTIHYSNGTEICIFDDPNYSPFLVSLDSAIVSRVDDLITYNYSAFNYVNEELVGETQYLFTINATSGVTHHFSIRDYNSTGDLTRDLTYSLIKTVIPEEPIEPIEPIDPSNPSDPTNDTEPLEVGFSGYFNSAILLVFPVFIAVFARRRRN